METAKIERTLHAVEHLLNLTVADIMRREVYTLDADDLLATAARKMIENKINGLVVMKNGKPWTVISSWDLLHLSYLESFSDHLDYLKTPIKEFIEEPVLHSLPPTASLMDAARLVAETNARTIPVIENDKLLGVFTTYDLINTYNNIIVIEKVKERKGK
ncbi:MAG: CBS domain-containing protein [Candidatus Hydrogenedentota bacterium]|nr:MAG: CBS domain-containing protein [Candidatus Hydrogenedentota bacterium]